MVSLVASLVGQTVKSLPTMRETRVQSLGWEDPLEKEMATHSSILAWRIPWMEELGGLQSTGRKESDTTERLYTHTHIYIYIYIYTYIHIHTHGACLVAQTVKNSPDPWAGTQLSN